MLGLFGDVLARRAALRAASSMPASQLAKRKKPPKPGQSIVLRRNQTAQPSKFGQRLSTLLVPAPSLLLLYHIEKTGGSSVFRWLQRQMREPPRLSALFAYGQTSCFFAMHADLFHKMSPRWRAKMCGGEEMPDWRTARVAVQFHAYSKGFFNDHVLPVLPQLRARYAALGGRVVTTTMLREPASYLFSKYIMWPPHDKSTGHVMELPRWLPQAEGLQRTALLKAGPRAHTPGCPASGPTGLEESRARLRTFDLVGVTSCLTLLLAALEQAVGLPPDVARISNVYARPQGWRGKSGMEVASGGTLESLRANATTRAMLERVTRCDDTLYADALRRLPPRAAFASHTNATCTADAWLATHPHA